MTMPVDFEWDLDSGGADFSTFLLDLTESSGNVVAQPSTAPGSAGNSFSDANNRNESNNASEMNNSSELGQAASSSAQLLEPDDTETEPDLFLNPEISENSLPNDDIWKKFGIFDTDDKCKIDDELSDTFDDLTGFPWMNQMYSPPITNDAREIRNHDCMWAGTCISEKHDRNNSKNLQRTNILPIKRLPAPKPEEADLVPLTTPEGPAFMDRNRVFGRRGAVVAPTHARSVLLPPRVVSSTVTSLRPASTPSHTVTTKRLHRSRTLDSGGESPRPETPQSLSDHEDLNLDLPDMKAVEELVGDTFDYNFISDIVDNMANDGPGDDFGANQSDKVQQGASSSVSSSATTSKNAVNKARKTAAKQEAPLSRHYTDNSFFSDHCYHLNKNARIESLGVQTPSDSEEEIDVETVYGDLRKPNSRSSSSSGSVLPTNPSLSDRQQLQLTVASAINKKDVKKQSARTATVPTRNSASDDRTLKAKVATGGKRKTNAKNEVTKRTGANKRGAEFDDLNEVLNKSVKKKKCQTQNVTKPEKPKPKRNGKGGGRGSGGGSSDSEVDSIERRTIHNSMERQRRIDLRNSFEELRKLIPNTAGNEKAAKVLILSSGAEFCKALALQDHELTRKRAELRRQQEMLMARVSQLRRSLAAQR